MQMVTDTEFSHSQMEHFLPDIILQGTCGVAGMPGMDMQILSDFHKTLLSGDFDANII